MEKGNEFYFIPFLQSDCRQNALCRLQLRAFNVDLVNESHLGIHAERAGRTPVLQQTAAHQIDRFRGRVYAFRAECLNDFVQLLHGGDFDKLCFEQHCIPSLCNSVNNYPALCLSYPGECALSIVMRQSDYSFNKHKEKRYKRVKLN